MRVLLLSANTFQEPHPVYPLGLDYVTRALVPSHEVRTVDANCMDQEKELPAILKEFAPHAVGISLRNVDNGTPLGTKIFLDQTRGIVQAIRSKTDATVILGGSGFSLFPARLMEELGADYGIVGEGERLADLLAALENGTPHSGLTGVVAAGTLRVNPVPWTGEPSRVDPRKNTYTSFYLDRGGILNFQTKRGCPFQCIYCTYPFLEGSKMRLFPPKEIGETAKRLQDAGAKVLYVTDSVFNAHEEHSLAVARSMKAAGVSVPWGAFFAPCVSSPGYFHELAENGCTLVQFGTEALCEPMLETYRKPFTKEDVFTAHGQAQEAGLFVAHHFLLGGPGETEETVLQTLAEIEKLPRSVFFFYCGIRIHPGTQIHSMALQEGSLDPNEDLLAPVFYTSRGITNAAVIDLVENFARGRANWVTPRSTQRMARITRRLYDLGHSGVLWERLIA